MAQLTDQPGMQDVADDVTTKLQTRSNPCTSPAGLSEASQRTADLSCARSRLRRRLRDLGPHTGRGARSIGGHPGTQPSLIAATGRVADTSTTWILNARNLTGTARIPRLDIPLRPLGVWVRTIDPTLGSVGVGIIRT